MGDEFLECLNVLHENGFRVRGVACDNHSSKVSSYTKLLAHCGQSNNDLFKILNESKIYLFFHTVHLIKNIRNNLLSNKRFPPFIFQSLYDYVKVTGGEISLRLLQEVYEKDEKLEAHLKQQQN